MKSALEGTTVVELADYITGPYATMLLADMGARVIKLEAPGRGDPFRLWEEGGYSSIFCTFNLGKESITLDLNVAEAREVAQALVKRADVFLENHRPGVSERLGLGYEQLRQLNPSLVYCSISGFGQDGPYRGRPARPGTHRARRGGVGVCSDERGG